MDPKIVKRFLSTKTAKEFDALKQELVIKSIPLKGLPLELTLHWCSLHHAWDDDPDICEEPAELFEALTGDKSLEELERAGTIHIIKSI